ncbi:MAG: cytochrome c3 family protein [Thermodesulfovibrionales bacterium]
MKKVLLAAVSTLLVAGIAYGGTIVGSKHDFAGGPMASTYNTNATPTKQVCVFCHVPHNGGTAGAPLWNHTSSTATYTLYDNTYSATIDGTVAAGGPGAVSKACLSCHDGSVAIASVVNQPRDGGISGTAKINAQFNLGTDLRNDHPVGITYEPAKDVMLNANTNATVVGAAATLPLYGGTAPYTVECASCHNVHDPVNVPFLRASNAASALCVTCHIK